MFYTGELFPLINNLRIRSQLEAKILQLNIIIPSLETFYANMLFMTIRAKIFLKYLLLPLRKPRNKRKPIIYERLKRNWLVSRVPIVKTEDSSFLALEYR